MIKHTLCNIFRNGIFSLNHTEIIWNYDLYRRTVFYSNEKVKVTEANTKMLFLFSVRMVLCLWLLMCACFMSIYNLSKTNYTLALDKMFNWQLRWKKCIFNTETILYIMLMRYYILLINILKCRVKTNCSRKNKSAKHKNVNSLFVM